MIFAHSARTKMALSLLLLALLSTACARTSQAEGIAQTPIETIVNKGSDTMVNLALAWAEAFQAENPQVNISVTGGGSGTGIAALFNQTTDLANASREIKPDEVAEIESQGVEPVEFVVARDAIAVIVNPSNPVQELTLQQISDIYSGKINNWLEVGGEDRPIVRLSRETNSGTHVYFLEQVLRLGDKENKTLFSPDTLLLPSSVGITAEVSDNPNAIGYDGLGYITSEVKMLAVAVDSDTPAVLPSIDTVNNNLYPVSRDLYIYTAGQPKGVVKSYLDWILSAPAQEIVAELGFVPIKP